jgi:hypothetical protein
MDSGIRILPTREGVLLGFMMHLNNSNFTLGPSIAGKDGTKAFHKSYGRMAGIAGAQRRFSELRSGQPRVGKTAGSTVWSFILVLDFERCGF